MALKFCQWTYQEFAIRRYCHTQNLGCMTLVLLFSSLSSSMDCVNFLSCFQVPWSTYIQPYFDTKYNEILQSTFKGLVFLSFRIYFLGRLQNTLALNASLCIKCLCCHLLRVLTLWILSCKMDCWMLVGYFIYSHFIIEQSFPAENMYLSSGDITKHVGGSWWPLNVLISEVLGSVTWGNILNITAESFKSSRWRPTVVQNERLRAVLMVNVFCTSCIAYLFSYFFLQPSCFLQLKQEIISIFEQKIFCPENLGTYGGIKFVRFSSIGDSTYHVFSKAMCYGICMKLFFLFSFCFYMCEK